MITVTKRTLDLRDFPRYYERAHPYSDFEDPMGPPSRYI